MKYQPLNEWLEETFTKPPTPPTARKWCEKGDIPAKRIGSKWFVIINEDKPTVKSREKTRDDRLNKILMDGA